MAKHSKSKRSRRSRSRSRSSSGSDSDSSSSSASSSDSFSSSFSDISKSKVKSFKFNKRKSSVLAKWIVKGIGEKNLKSAREAYKPDVQRDKKAKYCASDLFTNPKLDETLYTAIKSVKSSSAAIANVDPLEKIYRKQTDSLLDMAKPLLFLLENGKKSKSNTKALKTLSVLWAHLFHDITDARRRNILSQTHPNHVGLLARAAHMLPVGGEELFGSTFINELISQVKTASLVNNSVAGPSATSTPAKHNHRRSPPTDTRDKNFSNNNRYVENSLFLANLPVAGRTAHFLNAWTRMTKDPWVLSTVYYGFKLEFISDPPFQRSIPPNASMDDVQVALCSAEVEALLKKGAVVETKEEGGYVSRFFLAPKKGPNEWRPIINLKPLNQFLRYRHFKMEGINTVRHTVRPGDFLAKVDLTDAFLTVPIFRGHRKYLRFRWGRKTFEFTCLPFGLSSSPRVFTKVLKVAVTFLRRTGIRLVIYLDDLLIVGTTAEECNDAVTQVIAVLESLGFLINFKKSETVPTQCIEYIGLITNSISMTIHLTDKKVIDIYLLCSEVLKKGKCSLRHLAKIIDNLNWATYAVSFAQAHYRSLQAIFITSSREYNDNLDVIISLNNDARTDLSWWITSADFSAGTPLLSARPDIRMSSDACPSGWGAVCQEVKTGGPWSGNEIGLHINNLEILAALKALECFASSLSDCTVEIEVDNTTAVSYINKLGGCRSRDLCDASLRIADFCEKRKIHLVAIFVPGFLNSLADAESRRPLSAGDWKLSPLAFMSICFEWKVQVDLFASDWNKQLPRFVSWFPQPNCWKVDAFSLSWKGLNAYCFPPFSLIPFCLSKLTEEKTGAVLVTPFWPGQPWFPHIMDLAVAVPRLLLPSPDLLTSPLGESHPLVRDNSIRLIAWKLSGDASLRTAFQKTLPPSSSPQLGKIQTLHTSPPGTLGEIGVLRGKRIPCLLATPI